MMFMVILKDVVKGNNSNDNKNNENDNDNGNNIRK